MTFYIFKLIWQFYILSQRGDKMTIHKSFI